MSTRDPRDTGGPAADDADTAEATDAADDAADAEVGDLAAWLRPALTPVATAPERAAAVRSHAHAELRRASEQLRARAARARRRTVFLVETSTALAAGFSYVLWTAIQLWPR
jgi:hypothetical protein